MATENNGVHVRTSIVITAMVTVVVLVVGVALIVYFASERGDGPTRQNDQRLGEGKKTTASNGLLCIVNCTSTSTRTPTTKKTRMMPQLTTSNLSSPPSSLTPTWFPMTTTPPETTTHPKHTFRLPQDLKAQSYNLTLTPYIYGNDPSKFYFDGEVAIQLYCNHATDVIVLHSTNLTYQNESIHVTPSDIRVVSHSFDIEKELVYFHLDRPLQVGKRYIVETKYTGLIWSDNFGLYISSYEMNGSKRYILGSQCMTTFARRILPCFDEPDRKASFTLTVNRWSKMTCLSNTELTTVSDNGTWARDKFEKTPVMSTYLLALAIGEFSKKKVVVNGVRISAWIRPTFDGQQQYALDIARVVLPYLEQFYGLSYPLKKYDMLAIPDHPWKAIENWGLVMFCESCMLKDAKSSADQERYVALNVAHALAHMWFGNFVTMRWWDNVWLNEGFSAYVENAAVAKAKPEWRFFENFRNTYTENAMAMDSYGSSHPLYVPVKHVNELFDISGDIILSKGAHVIKMLRFIVGERDFQNGVTTYLDKHKYGNANHTDLWKAFGEASGQDIIGVMSTWVMQMNFPLVHIRRITTADGGTALELTQERYILDSESEHTTYSSPFGYRWRIPMSVISNSAQYAEKNKIMWMDEHRSKVSYKLENKLEENAWIMGNPENNVFCRVNYDDANWRLLISEFRTPTKRRISAVDRITLIHDACHLARAGRLNTTVCLDLLLSTPFETEYPVLEAIFSHYNYIRDMLRDRRVYSLWMIRIQPIIRYSYTSLESDAPNASIQTRDKINLLTREACRYGIKKCLDRMQEAFRKRTKKVPEDIDPHIMQSAYCYGIQEGTSEDWWLVYNQLEKVTVFERSHMIAGLACTRQIHLLRMYLSLSVTKMRPQHIYYVIYHVSSNAVGADIAFNFIQEKWNVFVKLLGDRIYAYLSLTTRLMSTQTDLDKLCCTSTYRYVQLKRLLVTYSDYGHYADLMNMTVKLVGNNVEWTRNNEEDVYDWLKTK